MENPRLGPYELLARLAGGGAANVFLVREHRQGGSRLLALKVLLPHLADDEDFIRMFRAEAKIAARLQHPNLVAITGFGDVSGISCLAMEYVFGASLAQILRKSAQTKRPLSVGIILSIIASICEGLHHAHELVDESGRPTHLVHRDVTPQNILVSFRGVPKLTDFGIAKAPDRGWETQVGIVKGKFSYMSPEQAFGQSVDRRSDVFGMGIVLWESLTGQDLFKGGSPRDILEAIRKLDIPPPSEVVDGLTRVVDPIVLRALERTPAKRFPTAAAMASEIRELIRRAGMVLDESAIAKELAEVYGDVVLERGAALRRAMQGGITGPELARILDVQPMDLRALPQAFRDRLGREAADTRWDRGASVEADEFLEQLQTNDLSRSALAGRVALGSPELRPVGAPTPDGGMPVPARSDPAPMVPEAPQPEPRTFSFDTDTNAPVEPDTSPNEPVPFPRAAPARATSYSITRARSPSAPTDAGLQAPPSRPPSRAEAPLAPEPAFPRTEENEAPDAPGLPPEIHARTDLVSFTPVQVVVWGAVLWLSGAVVGFLLPELLARLGP